MSVAESRIFSLSPIILDPSFGLKREPVRPVEHRQPDFDQRFDFDTLFYDVFRHPDSDVIVMVGPPLNNLESFFNEVRIIALPANEVCSFRRIDLDRHMRVEVAAPAGTTTIVLKSWLGELSANVLPPETAWYKDKRTILTISKNNDLAWICDWVRFNRDIHGAQAVLIHDNGSTTYDIDDVRQAVSSLRGISFVGIVPFNFPFGPPGFGLRGLWDSNFLQIGSLEHARWRFLLDAKSILNTDVDELVVSSRGRSVFEAAEKKQIVRFFGAWIPNIATDRSRATPRHTDFAAVERPRYQFGLQFNANRCQPKWAAVPRKIPAHAGMTHHRIKGWWRSRLWSPSFVFRHFRGLSTGWKYKRDARESFDAASHKVDEDMKAAFARIDWTH